MTPEESAVMTPEAEVEEEAPAEALETSELEAEEDFNPLGQIEGWSAFECSYGPFGFRG